MQAGSLWAGHDYAYKPYRGRSTYPKGCQRIKVIKLIKQKDAWNERASTKVLAEILNKDGSSTGMERTVRGRDIVDFWDNYETWLEDQLEQDRINKEKKAAEKAEKARRTEQILERLREMQIPEGVFTVDTYSIYVNRQAFEEWLGIH